MLSGGQKAKVLLLKMSLSGANVLILDEPTRNFSPLSGPVIRKMIKELAKTEKTSFLLSSHNMLEIEFVSDRVGIIAGGKLLEVGKIDEIKEKYGAANLEEVFERVVNSK